MDKVLEIENLEVGYKAGQPLYEAFSASLGEGELVALIGPNGAGKTSLLRTLTGNLKPLSGKVSLLGKEVSSYSMSERSLLFSLVLTEQPDDTFMKVFDVVSAGRYPHINMFGRLSSADCDIVEQSLGMVGARHLIDRTFVSLSDGEKQKVMIAKSLAQDTPILFMDEPMAFLDFTSKIEMMDILEKLASEQKKTIIFSSHDLDMLLRYNSTMWMVAPNKPIRMGEPNDLAASGLIDEYFSIPQGKGFSAQ